MDRGKTRQKDKRTVIPARGKSEEEKTAFLYVRIADLRYTLCILCIYLVTYGTKNISKYFT